MYHITQLILSIRYLIFSTIRSDYYSSFSRSYSSFSVVIMLMASHWMMLRNSQKNTPSSLSLRSLKHSSTTRLIFFSVREASWSILFTSSFLIQYYPALLWILVLAWLLQIFLSWSQLLLIKEMILAFSRIFLLNSVNSSSYLSISVIFWITFDTAESKVSPFIIKVDVWRNWIARRRMAMNWGNLMPKLLTSKVSSKVLNLQSLLQNSRKLSRSLSSGNTWQSLRK